MQLRRHLALASTLFLAPLASPAADSVVLEVSAGKHARRDTPVLWDVPAALKSWNQFFLYRLDGNRETPVDVQAWNFEPRQLCWIVDELKAGATHRYRLAGRRYASSPKSTRGTVECSNDGTRLLFRSSGKTVLAYNHAVMQPPEGYAPIFARSGYIHPVWNPAGNSITNDFPPNHKHHHGVWFPWTNTVFEGRKVDFWNSASAQGKVEFVKFDSYGSGRVFGWFRSRQRHIDLKAPGGPKTVLHEVWEVRVYPFSDHFVFDLTSVQACATDSPLQLKKYRYGGLGFRGSEEWEGPHAHYLTSEGRTRKDGHATTAKWCEVYGEVHGKATGVTIMSHPANFRHPQNMRIHPSEPFFNFAPCQAGDFAIRPGEPYVSRYRFYVHDGEVDARVSERLWNDYGDPPTVRLVGG